MTSIDWLFEKLWDESKDKLTWHSILEQAKEMHKQEIIDAYANAVMKENNSDYIGMNEQVSGEIYYQETFVSKGSDTLKDYHPVDTNKMIDHIGEVNEMVEDDVEKLAEEEFSDNQLKDMYSYEDAIRFRGKLSYARKGFVKGYNKAKETLYTEEQVRELIKEANYDGQSLHAKSVTSQMMRDNAESYSEEIIQSLKQPKQ